MKTMKFINQLADVMFCGFGFGTVFCLIQMFVSHRPYRSGGLMLICIGLALAFANLEVWTERQMLIARDAEAAKVVYKEAKRNRVNELYEKEAS